MSKLTCMGGTATQPATYSGNFLLDCDAEVPHNETSVVVNPTNANHIVGGYHDYQVSFLGATVVARIIGTVSVSFNGGQTWQQSVPPITPFQFTGDPALAFDASGRLYFANIADHEGPGGPFTGPSVVVATSNNGGVTWSKPVVVADGHGAVAFGASGQLVFQDKEYIAADTSSASPFQNRVYVTWTSFQEFFTPTVASFRSPIMVSFSDNGTNWADFREVSGISTECSVQFFGGSPNQCEENQDSYPTVAPNGRVYVSFENFNTPAENQVMVVRSNNGGQTWSNPVRVDALFDINLPQNTDGRDTLTGCQLRVGAMANSAADPSDYTGGTVYVVWADNRNGGPTSSDPTNLDVFLGRSTNGGQSWTVYTVDNTANDQFFPWVAVAPDGRVDIGYMDRSWSSGTQSQACEYGFTLTRLTFDAGGAINSQTRTRVDTGLSDAKHSRWFSTTANPASRFVGDYNGVAVDSDGKTWSLWTDQRNVLANPPSPMRNHGQHAVAGRTP